MEMNSRASSKKRGCGRRKIAIERIENNEARQVCFSKRRRGLFKKAAEISILCGVDIAVVAFSPGGKPFTFGNPKIIDAAIDRLQHPTLDLLPPPPPSNPILGSLSDQCDESGQTFDARPGMMPAGPAEVPWWGASVDPPFNTEIGELVERNETMDALQWDCISHTGEMETMDALWWDGISHTGEMETMDALRRDGISHTGEMETMNAGVLGDQWPLVFLDF